MKKVLTLLIVMIMVLSNTSISSYRLYSSDRAPHVIYQVEWTSDISAKVKLLWSVEGIDEGIMINSYKKIDDQTLEVSYTIGADAKEGFDERTLQVPDMLFPCIIRLKENSPETSAGPDFSDLSKDADRNKRIKHLFDLGIIEGYSDGTFRPGGSVKRAEFSKMLFYSAKMSYNLESDLQFTDVHSSHWAIDYIYTLAANKIVEGRGNGIFDPEGTITIAEILAIIDRTFTVYNSSGSYSYDLANHWSNSNFISMVNAGIVLPIDDFYYPYTPDRVATREECALLLSRVLEQYHEAK